MKNSIAFKKLRSIFRNKKQDEVFSSKSFANAFSSLARMVSNRYSLKNPINVKLVIDNEGSIAYTDNKDIVINLNNSITSMVNTLEEKYLTFLGMLGHECGHLLFTDFNIIKKIREDFMNKSLYIEAPEFSDKYLKDNFDKIISKVFSENDSSIDLFVNIFHQVQNILEDKYVNERIKHIFPGTFKQGINKIYELMFLPNNNQLDENITKFEQFINYTHKYLEFGDKVDAEKVFKEFSDDSFICFLNSVESKNSMNERVQAVYILFAYAADYLLELLDDVNEMKQMFDNLVSSSSTTQIGSGKGELSYSSSESKGNSNEEENGSSNSSSDINKENSDDKNANSSDNSSDAEDNNEYEKNPISISDILNGHIRSLLQHNPDSAKDILCRERSYEVMGHGDLSPSFNKTKKDKDKYSDLLIGLKPYINRLIRGFTEIVDERATGLRSRNLLSGTKINPSATATSNGKVFMKNKLPEEMSEVAVCVLIDQSGSMMGQRIMAAKSTSIILAEFCEKLNLPYSIIGHDYSHKCDLHIYSDFEDGNNSKYSLATMSAGFCNRDGFALRYAVKSLSERPEPSKLLFVISDGWPSAYSSADEATNDIRKGIQLAKKNDILLSVMAIGEDKDRIQSLYGDAFVDISDLSKLHKKIINKVKRYIS